jgi:hypothetical protein
MKSQKGSLFVTILIIAAGVIITAVFVGLFKKGQYVQIRPSDISENTEPENLFGIDFQTPGTQTINGTVAINTNYNCGINLDNPEGQIVTVPFVVSGYLNGCNWGEENGKGGTVEVYYLGLPISPIYDLNILSSDGYPKYFTATINQLNSFPPTSLLVFKNNDFENSNTQTHQISIQFNQ